MIIYKELNNLSSYFNSAGISFKRYQSEDVQSLKAMDINLNNSSFFIYIDDEYNDINEDNPLMCFFLILRELEIYKDSTDYLDWCKQLGVDANDEKLRQYYISLDSTYNKIEKILGKINSCINSMDYQLNNGVIQKLRNI